MERWAGIYPAAAKYQNQNDQENNEAHGKFSIFWVGKNSGLAAPDLAPRGKAASVPRMPSSEGTP
jgi:hypothetical protein